MSRAGHVTGPSFIPLRERIFVRTENINQNRLASLADIARRRTARVD